MARQTALEPAGAPIRHSCGRKVIDRVGRSGMPLIDRTGQRFGRLTALRHLGWRAGGWECRCDCGSTVMVTGGHLAALHTTSCGCLKPRPHGDARRGRRSAEWRAWVAMRARCGNPNRPDFQYYGGRGIEVAAEWRDDFAAFLRYMGRRPSAKHSLDRWPNPDGNYEPGNCRWATMLQQRHNRSRRAQ